MVRVQPVEIYQSEAGDLVIAWQGGAESRIAARTLRLHCPCAECSSRAHMTTSTYLPLMTSNAVTIREINLVGSSAIHITWGDGHANGIYPYSLIRDLAPPAGTASV
ncbi:MAG: DUF971 domain-containing protein [Bacteroidota bacterium]